jgi:hypothetical protein
VICELERRQRWRARLQPHEVHDATHMARTIIRIAGGRVFYRAARRRDVVPGECSPGDFRRWLQERNCVREPDED